MGDPGHVLGNEAAEEALEVHLHVRISVFLD